MSLLTEQEITEIVREAAKGSAIRRDGSTSFRIARAIESAVIEKIKAQGPVAEIQTGHYGGRSRNIGFAKANLLPQGECLPTGTKLYRLPEGD